MSKESMEHLNNLTLIGYTDKRGNAWHYRADLQGAEPNHYPLAIPIADVERRLFDWEAVEGTISVQAMLPDGRTIVSTDERKKAIMRSDTGAIMGYFSGQAGAQNGYTIHQYKDVLLAKVADLLDQSRGELDIGSAGFLQDGGQAWIQIEMAETMTANGFDYRPYLLAAASHNGTLAVTYGAAVNATVCDNTMSAALRSMGERKFKVKHSRYSQLKLQNARDAIGIISDVGEQFAAQIQELNEITVTDNDWAKFLDSLTPIPEPVSDTKDGRARTVAIDKRDTLTHLYKHDPRCAPWTGTAFGVVQTVNTYVHHEQVVRNASRADRNMDRAISGGIDTLDRDTLTTLQEVLTAA